MLASPEIERVYAQLQWIERRRQRVIESVSAHFGHALVQRILLSEPALPSPLAGLPAFSSLLDEREVEPFVESLAIEMDRAEASTITALRGHVSVYQAHVDEQILFGSRTAGQEAGRIFLSRNTVPGGSLGARAFDIPRAIEAIFEFAYHGLPWDHNYFLCVRSLGGSTVHYRRSPHLTGWLSAGGDPKFLFSVKCEWIRGMLDILSPSTLFTTTQAIEQGHPFGLAHFHSQSAHAGP